MNNTDWVDQTIGVGVKESTSFSVKYGNEKLKSYANISYDQNESYLVGNSYDRLSGRLNFDYDRLAVQDQQSDERLAVARQKLEKK